jgi:glycosyltransferase involved in cell wall biosynthesis
MNAVRPLRVAYVTMRYPLASETFATLDVRALSAAGVDVTVLAMRAGPTGEALLRERGVAHVPVVRSRALSRMGWALALRTPGRALTAFAGLVRLSWRAPASLAAGLWLLPAALGVASRAEAERFDVVHLRWGHHPALVGAILKWWDSPVVVSLSLSAYDLEAAVPVSLWLAPRADVVRTLARVNVAAIADRFGRRPENVEVIVNGVPDEVLDAPLEVKDVGLVVTAGRLIASKRMDDALRAFAVAAGGTPGARLEVLGDGPERSRLEELARQLGIADRTHFRGMVPYAEVVRTMRRAAVFLFLSDKSSERLPNVIKEAQAGGCAIVTTTTPGIEELVEDGHSGFLVAARDTSAAAERLVRLLVSPKLAVSMGVAGRDHVRHHFRLSDSIGAYLAAWAGAVDARTRMGS